MWRKTPAKRQAPLFSITLRLCLVLFLFSLSERRREWKILLWIEHLAFYCGVEDRKWIRYSTRSDPIGSTRKPPASSIPLVMTSMYVPNSTHLFSFFFQISLFFSSWEIGNFSNWSIIRIIFLLLLILYVNEWKMGMNTVCDPSRIW